jgi:hypothetical protein
MFTKTFISFADSWDLNIPRIEESMLRGMKPGKILRREILLSRPDYKAADMLQMLDGAIQQGLAALYADQYVSEIQFAYSREKIEEIYADENCPSCMSDLWAAEVAGEFYTANGFVVAYRHNGRNVTARCVTFGKTFTNAYGPESSKLLAGLEEMGYHNSCVEPLFPAWTHYMVPYHNGSWYIPYLDECDWAFIPLNTQPIDSLWECLLVPMSIDDGIDDLNDVQRFQELGKQIESNLYLDVLLEKTTHGAPCEINGALHHIEQFYEEPRCRWNLLRISGRLFWLQWRSDGYCERYFMDDYGNTQNARFDPPYYVREEIELGRWGQF